MEFGPFIKTGGGVQLERACPTPFELGRSLKDNAE
jgi:hypothetical protein